MSRKIVGSAAGDLLTYPAMIDSLLTLGIFWHVIQTWPGLLESLAYVYGMMLASFTVDLYIQRDLGDE